MSLLNVRLALYNRLGTLSPSLPTLYENEPDFNETNPFQTAILIPGPPENPTYGDNYYRENGIFRIRLFYPSREGIGNATARASQIRDHFFRGLSLSEGDITVIIRRTPNITTGSIVVDKYVLAVDIDYFASVYKNV